LYIACFYYFALSVAAPFTGGHMNPGTTVAFHLVKKNSNMIYYFIAQLLGAFIAGIAGNFLIMKHITFLMLPLPLM
jgi:glycerol uptake facilitator-like aquaporin